jgi:K+-sensing histidine kinase KdpD
MFFNYWANKGPLFLPYYLLLSTLYFLPFIYSIYSYLRSKAFKDLLLVIALIICVSGGFTNWFLWFDIQIPPFGIISLSIYSIILTLLLLKLNLFDITIIINRAAARVITTLLFLGLYLLAVYGFWQYGGLWVTPEFLVFSIIFGTIMGEVYHLVRQFIQTAAVDKWISDFYDADKVFDALADALVPILQQADAVRITAAQVQAGLKLKNSWYLCQNLFETNKPETPLPFPANEQLLNYFAQIKTPVIYKNIPDLEQASASLPFSVNSLLVPLHSSQGLVAILILKEKISEANFAAKDLQLLSRIAKHVALIFDRALPYEQIKANYAKALELAAIAKTVVTLNHEINSPLTSILTASQILSMTEDRSEQETNLINIIIEQTQKIKKIIYKLREIQNPVTVEYLQDIEMLELE